MLFECLIGLMPVFAWLLPGVLCRYTYMVAMQCQVHTLSQTGSFTSKHKYSKANSQALYLGYHLDIHCSRPLSRAQLTMTWCVYLTEECLSL